MCPPSMGSGVRAPGLDPSSEPVQPRDHRLSLFSSVAQLCPTLCDSMDCSTPGFPVHHRLPEHERLPEILVVPREKTHETPPS